MHAGVRGSVYFMSLISVHLFLNRAIAVKDNHEFPRNDMAALKNCKKEFCSCPHILKYSKLIDFKL